jgi:hypothetical protein
VLLLLPILAAAVKLEACPTPVAIKVGGALLILVNAIMLITMMNRTSSEWYVWVTPCILFGSFVVIRLTSENNVSAPGFALQSPIGA